MSELKVKTKGDADPKGKARVYFTCHPKDFDKYFELVCEKLFASHDCAVYYTENMSDQLSDDEYETDLGHINLFVIPVTLSLLTTPNRAMDSDFPFAKRSLIPVLPLLFDKELDGTYSRPDKFGSLQYLAPFSKDVTEISFEEKLERYLKSVLVDDRTAERVRAAFDAYIFLSYRKKDRKKANELMRLIHSVPRCRDIAIWYDEFLTPGENFSENIQRAMEKSELFALLVTPNLVNEENYVRDVEYPAAVEAGMDILAAEAEKTDPDVLRACFPGLKDEAVDIRDADQFQARLMTTIRRLGLETENTGSVHTYLIGLAYLDGIDVEVDRKRAVQLITSAAEMDLPEAVKKLISMYREGVGVPRDYHAACRWSKKYVSICEREYGEKDVRVLNARHDLGLLYDTLGDYRSALEIFNEIYSLRCQIQGKESRASLGELFCIAHIYSQMHEYSRALEIEEELYRIRAEIYGEQDLETQNVLSAIALAYSEQGNYRKAREIQEKILENYRSIYGEEHERTLTAVNNLAVTCGRMGDYSQEASLLQDALKIWKKTRKEDQPEAMTAKTNLAECYKGMGKYRQALSLLDTLATRQKKLLGENHPSRLFTLDSMAGALWNIGDHGQSLMLEERIYKIKQTIYGEDNISTMLTRGNYAVSCISLGHYSKAAEILEDLIPREKRILGEEHPGTLTDLHNLAFVYGELGQREKARDMQEHIYEAQSRLLGEKHPDTMNTLNSLGYSYRKLGNHKRSFELYLKAYQLRKESLGPDHINTIRSLVDVMVGAYNLGDQRTAVTYADELCKYKKVQIEKFIGDIVNIYQNCNEREKAAALQQRS